MTDETTTWEEPHCPLCGAAEAVSAYRWPEPPHYRVQRCGNCAFHYLSPRPVEEDMAGLYQDGAYYASEQTGYSSYDAQEAALSLTFRRLMTNLGKRGLLGGRLLALGAVAIATGVVVD